MEPIVEREDVFLIMGKLADIRDELQQIRMLLGGEGGEEEEEEDA